MAKKTVAEVNRAMDIDGDMNEYKPSIDIDEKMYPDLKNVKLDQEITLTLRVKVKGISRNRWDGDKLHVSGEIQNAQPETDMEGEVDDD